MRVHPTAPCGRGRCGGEVPDVPGERRRHDDQRGARPDEECSGAVPCHGPVLTDALDRRPASAGCVGVPACWAEARGASPCTDESAAARPTGGGRRLVARDHRPVWSTTARCPASAGRPEDRTAAPVSWRTPRDACLQPVGLRPNRLRNQREKALGAAKPSWQETSVSDRRSLARYRSAMVALTSFTIDV